MAQPLPFLTDTQWRSIEAAAAPHVGSDRARAEIEDCLHDYCNLPKIDPAQLRVERKRWQRIADLARDLATEIFAVKQRQTPWSNIALLLGYDPDRPPLRTARILQNWAEEHAEARNMLMTAVGSRQNPARAWLLGRLLRIWTDCFGGKPTVTGPPDGSAARGPLVDFIQAVTAGVLDPPATGGEVHYAVRPKPKKKKQRRRSKLKKKKQRRAHQLKRRRRK